MLKIGEVASSTEIPIATIRYYERMGLLETPERTASGYRQYSEGVIKRLRFIHQAKSLGFTLNEIKELLSISVRPGNTCGAVRQQTEAKLADVEKKLQELQRIKRALLILNRECPGVGSRNECPILDALSQQIK